MTMGTASTMTSVAEVLGMTLPGAASIPAVDSGHSRMAAASGARIVEMVWEDMTPATLLTADAFADAVVAVLALGGSTNAVIHLVAMARRAGVALSLSDFDETARSVPVLADIQPSGTYLMEDFYYAGGLRGLLTRLTPWLHLDRRVASGWTLGETLAGAEVYSPEVIRPLDNPLSPEGGLAVLHGNLAPAGAVIKHIAADPRLLKHTGPAVVFTDYADMQRRIDTVPVTADSVLVLRGSGPQGGPGMPEHGMLPIPKSLLEQGIRDMVRISDARMSGTSFGTCVLHVAPESHVGGPLAVVRDGDLITLDVPGRRLELEISNEELVTRLAAWTPPPLKYPRGYAALHAEHILQADEGCDFDFLATPGETPEPEAG
jgi:dihydroxy-acid dehydratase